MNFVRIKICGITSSEDALVATQLGVDALGFNFVKKSPRCIAPEAAAEIIRQLPPYISRVGIFADETPESVNMQSRIAKIDSVQLHGSETADYCRTIDLPVVKALGLRPDFDFSLLDTFPVAGVLLDTWNKGLTGGSGISGDWTIAKKAADRYGRIILAGGLGPSNLEAALTAVRPYGVDINSGVEIRPGVKNPHKMRDAVKIVRQWQPAVR